MKYWICKDIDNKVYLYCGKSRPHYDENQGFDGTEWNWIEEEVLDLLYINRPKDLKAGDCRRIFVNIKDWSINIPIFLLFIFFVFFLKYKLFQ